MSYYRPGSALLKQQQQKVATPQVVVVGPEWARHLTSAARMLLVSPPKVPARRFAYNKKSGRAGATATTPDAAVRGGGESLATAAPAVVPFTIDLPHWEPVHRTTAALRRAIDLSTPQQVP